jgi:hypothetical protein
VRAFGGLTFNLFATVATVLRNDSLSVLDRTVFVLHRPQYLAHHLSLQLCCVTVIGSERDGICRIAVCGIGTFALRRFGPGFRAPL